MKMEDAISYVETLSTEALVELLAQRIQDDFRKKSGGEMKFGHYRIYIHEGTFSKVEAWPRDILIKGETVRRRSKVA